MIRILICGDREWFNSEFIFGVVEIEHKAHHIDIIIEGEARGADTIGRMAGEFYGIPILKFPANWKKYGKAAGPIRNQQMLDEGKPTEVWAFHNDIESSRGTKDMVNRAKKAGIPVTIYKEENG